jgi:hypothetical protein
VSRDRVRYTLYIVAIVVFAISLFLALERESNNYYSIQYNLYCNGEPVALIDHKKCRLTGCNALSVEDGRAIQFGLDQCYLIEAGG